MNKFFFKTVIGSAMMVGGFATAFAQTYIVDRYQDDQQQGSLRWAIEQANRQPQQQSTIQIHAVGQAPYVIKLNSQLPAIKAPVTIEGMQWAKNGEFIRIDGSGYIRGEGAKACPGAIAGQYGTNVRTTSLPGFILQDVNGVTIRGLDIHHFCIGVLINRSSNNLITHNRVSNNYGGSGVMITGDDGQGNPTSTTTNNNKVIDNLFIDNGDGLELTRGAAFNLVANNYFTSTKENPEPSQGIEILWGNDNAIIGNKFENYSDGLQINWGKRNYIAYNELSKNSIGFNLTGDGNILDSNKIHDNRIGIAIRSEKEANARITLTKNQIWNNAKNIKRCEAGGSCVENQRLGAIVFAVPALEHVGFVGSRGGGVEIPLEKQQKTCSTEGQGDCNAIPNQNIRPPVLSLRGSIVQIHISGQPQQNYHVEIFANDVRQGNEAQKYLGTVKVSTDAQGKGLVQWRATVAKGALTATVTDYLGATSELSQPLKLH
ncbi:3-dehydroshikimate dehydratase [Acinetobacter qingfengensis]|uniref:3-dehydroshikimate dehydratase n=1 Tax=Acinetobacter qingfengensis TaxID=1262585 RepID=A0A1E7RDE4_9GAMM|nr:NosD domain-containing protein [Acinetobacter qingfengensis]KAA8734455.1 3-dehydroshikimate dehydratase [Acinetobacter qingfengensis]OEY97368.1 3-dehydroshikimate dehydratase [Acinetobacter qingfengensis]